MAINHTTLTAAKTTTGSIANWVNRGDLPTDNILLEAEAWIYERLRVREMMEVNSSFQFDQSASTEALPSGFLDPISFLPHGYGDPLPFFHEEMFRPLRNTSGTLYTDTPTRWTIIGTTAHVNCLCDENFAGELMYYKQPDALSGSNETNFLTTRYPSLLRYACMMKAYEHMKDNKMIDKYLTFAMNALGSANASNEMWRRGQHVPS